MVPELEKPRITEIQVRMDCNGCIQKIKKALHGINGIYAIYVDFPQQKLTVVGTADPEKIIKAIKKTRKLATICAHTEPDDPNAPAPGGEPPAPPTETPPTDPAGPAPTEPPKDPPPPENLPPEVTPSPIPAETVTVHPAGPSESKDVEEVQVIHHHLSHGYGHGAHWISNYSGQGVHHHPQDYGHGAHWVSNYSGHSVQQDVPHRYVTHSYNSYKPSAYVSEYVRSPPRTSPYEMMECYGDDEYRHGNGHANNIDSVFSDENPNACRIA